MELLYKERRQVKLFNKISRDLSKINQKTEQENMKLTLKVTLISVTVGVVYFLFSISIFNKLWYHQIIALVAAIIMTKSIIDLMIEIIENRFKKGLPQMIRVFGYYYQHYNGNLNKALDASIERTRDENKIYLQKIKMAINKENYNQEMEYLKRNMPSVWLKLLCNLIIFAKREGNREAIAPNLNKLTYIINFVNLSQGLNNVEFLWIEIGLLLVPIVVIPFTQLYNGMIFQAIDYENLYNSIDSQTKASVIFITANILALFVNWIRKVK